jgi:type IV pilus assembly protein PilC
LPKFTYIAVDASGATVDGAVKRETIGEVRVWLRERSLFPVKISEKKRALLDFEVTSEKLKKRELMHFSRQLAVFMRAGIPIIDSLETIADEAHDKVLRRVIADMVERLRGGATFADAAAAHPEAFPAYYLGVLKSAELTCRLDETVDQLAGYLDREITARSKVVSALVYPAVVFVLAIITIAVLAVIVLPQFKKLFEEMETDLPLPTRLLLGLTGFVTDMWYVPVGLTLIVLLAFAWLMSTSNGKAARDKLILDLPIIGEIVQYSILERFCRILSTMTSAGVPLPEAMQVTTESTSNTVYRLKLEQARAEMVRGAGLARPLIETGLFPGAARQMMTVGEETGTLDEQLATASLYFDRELEVKIRRFTSLFEPATILFVGAAVGFVAIALVSAMYGVLNGFNQEENGR